MMSPERSAFQEVFGTENYQEAIGLSHCIVRHALNSVAFDDAIYQRALAAGETEKSARARATIPVTSPSETVSSASPEIKPETKTEHAGGHYLTKSEYIWGEFFLFLRWVVAAVVIVLIVLAFTAPQVAPSCF